MMDSVTSTGSGVNVFGSVMALLLNRMIFQTTSEKTAYLCCTHLPLIFIIRRLDGPCKRQSPGYPAEESSNGGESKQDKQRNDALTVLLAVAADMSAHHGHQR